MADGPGRADDNLIERLRGPFRDAAEAVFFHGSTPWEVDEAMEAFGFARGPFAAEDEIGLDRTWSLWQVESRPEGLPILHRMMELGKLGRKTGAGWYRYPGGGGKVEDPIVADLALEEAHFQRVTRRADYAPEEIRLRLLTALVAAAAGLRAEGVPEAEIDRASVEGLGFPAETGGVLAWARLLGAARLAEMVRETRYEGRVRVPTVPGMDLGRLPGD